MESLLLLERKENDKHSSESTDIRAELLGLCMAQQGRMDSPHDFLERQKFAMRLGSALHEGVVGHHLYVGPRRRRRRTCRCAPP